MSAHVWRFESDFPFGTKYADKNKPKSKTNIKLHINNRKRKISNLPSVSVRKNVLNFYGAYL